MPHSLRVSKNGNKLIFEFKKGNNALLILFLLGFLFLAGYATYAGVQLIGKSKMNIDLNGDGIPDLNIDLDGDGICDVNCDTNKDKKPDQNIDYRNSNKPTFNVVRPDGTIFNEMNQLDESGKCKLNCDTDKDGWPDTNIDLDGDGKADINIDIDGDGNPDLNIDTNGDGKPDFNIDEDGDGKCDRNCTYIIDKNGKGGSTTIGDNGANIEAAALVVMFEDGNNIALSNLYPDDQDDPNVNTKVPDIRFSIENTTDKPLKYNIEWIDVENTFTSPNFWFKVSSTYNGFNQDWTTAPKSNGRMATEVVVAPKSKQIYTVSFTLHGTGQPQNYDQGKYFRGKVAIDIIED